MPSENHSFYLFFESLLAMSKRRKKRKNNKITVTTVNKKVNKLARTLKPEMHVRTISVNSATISNTGLIQQLDLIPEGDNINTRTGLKVRIKGIGIHGHLARSATTNNVTAVRIMIFVDLRQEIDAKTTPAVLLQETHPLSYLNQARTDRFRILFNRFFILHEQSPVKRVIWWKRLDFQQSYNGTLGTDVEMKNIWMLTLADQASLLPTWVFGSRIVFTDV